MTRTLTSTETTRTQPQRSQPQQTSSPSHSPPQTSMLHWAPSSHARLLAWSLPQGLCEAARRGLHGHRLSSTLRIRRCWRKDKRATQERTCPWTNNTSSLVRKVHQLLFFLWTLKENHQASDVWELLSRWASGAAAGGQNCSTRHRDSFQPPRTSRGNAVYVRFAAFFRTPPILQTDCLTFFPPGGASGASGQQTQEEFLPCCCLLPELWTLLTSTATGFCVA